MTGPKVLLVGLRSDAVDFAKWPGLTKDTLERAFELIEKKLGEAGFVTRWCLTDDGETAARELLSAVKDFEPDIVSIGAGIRADPDHLRLFESLVNLVHRAAPAARFAFNTDPMDTIGSVARAAAG